LAGTRAGCDDTCWMGKERFEESDPPRKYAVTNCNKVEQTVGPLLPPGALKRELAELATAIPPFAKLILLLLLIKMRACGCGWFQLVQLLLRHGANPLAKNSDGESALDVASALEVTRLLRREIIASSSSDDEYEVRSPTSPESDDVSELSPTPRRGATVTSEPPSATLQETDVTAGHTQLRHDDDDDDDKHTGGQCA